jgi:hypothetical protein
VNLDPQIAPLIEALNAGFPPVHTMTGAQATAPLRLGCAYADHLLYRR